MLSDLATFKDHLRKTGDTEDDALTKVLSGVNQQILTYLGREVEVKQRTLTFDVLSFQQEFLLPASPIHDLTYVRYDPNREFGSETALDTDEYDWESEVRRKRGVIYLDRVDLPPGRGYLKVSWVGGWGFDRDAYLSRESDPPGSPANGDIYLVGDSATGAWAGKQNQLATYDGSTWTFQTAIEALRERLPDLEVALLNQASYLYRTKDHQGTQTVTNKFGSVNVRSLGFLNSTLDLIRRHKYMSV